MPRHMLGTMLLASLAGSACAGPGERIVDVAYQDGGITMRDARNGAPLMMPRPGVPLHEGRAGGPLAPTMEFTPQDDGFDLRVTYVNNTDTPQPLGDLNVNTITLGDSVQWRDFRWAGEEREMTLANPPGFAHNYPGDLYSPVALLANDHYAIGLSVQYPILEYKHDVAIALRTRGGRAAEGEGGQGWHVRLHFSDPDGRRAATLYTPALIPPGESRTYVITARVSSDPSQWMTTLDPYRRYFQTTYGPVHYQRNAAPVMGVPLADASLISADNPRGWTRAYAGMRPDQRGFEPWVNDLTSNRQFDRMMLWAPAGLYRFNREHNYPFQFTSPWLTDDKLRTALDTQRGFPRLVASGKQLGLWWGRSGWYADRWDDDVIDPFNPSNSRHVEAALRELDTAAQAGATTIGLDAFGHAAIRLWDGVEWLERMQQRHPEVAFIVEPRTSDIMHNLTPMYYPGYLLPQTARTYDDLSRIHSPHYLADLLNPGHETWAALRWDMYPRYFGAPATTPQVRSDCVRAANFGFVPLIFWNIDTDRRMSAVESWKQTVPESMRTHASQEQQDVADVTDEQSAAEPAPPRLAPTGVRPFQPEASPGMAVGDAPDSSSTQPEDATIRVFSTMYQRIGGVLQDSRSARFRSNTPTRFVFRDSGGTTTRKSSRGNRRRR